VAQTELRGAPPSAQRVSRCQSGGPASNLREASNRLYAGAAAFAYGFFQSCSRFEPNISQVSPIDACGAAPPMTMP
jgi:hypothetical protein